MIAYSFTQNNQILFISSRLYHSHICTTNCDNAHTLVFSSNLTGSAPNADSSWWLISSTASPHLSIPKPLCNMLTTWNAVQLVSVYCHWESGITKSLWGCPLNTKTRLLVKRGSCSGGHWLNRLGLDPRTYRQTLIKETTSSHTVYYYYQVNEWDELLINYWFEFNIKD